MTRPTRPVCTRNEKDFEAAMPITGPVETYFGEFELDHSLPTRDTANRIHDLIDLQLAARLYL